VIGNNGEMRLVQRALFEGEHYELGLLFVENQLKDLQVMGQCKTSIKNGIRY